MSTEASTAGFRDEFERILSSDYVMLDNTADMTWREGNPGHFLIVVSPKSEEVFDEIKEHSVKVIREMAKELLFKAEAQELVVNKIRSAVFKITPLKT